MKKILVICLVMVMLVSVVACGTQTQTPNEDVNTPVEDPSETPDAPAEENANGDSVSGGETVMTDIGEVQILSCSFTEEVRAIDSEFAGSLYEKTENRVYIDTVILVSNAAKEVTEDDFTGSVVYGEDTYNLQYSTETKSCIGVGNGTVAAGDSGRVHMFVKLDKAAADADLTVDLNVAGKEFTCKVDALNSVPSVEKTLLKKGDKHTTAFGDIEFEVLDCIYTEFLQPTDTENGNQYLGGPYVDCILKITNNGSNPIDEVYGYAIKGETVERCGDRIENENNTDFEYFYDTPIEPGKTEYVHIFSKAPESETSCNIRMNLGGSCYYTVVEW